MPPRIPNATLRKIRDMLRAGFTQTEAARACDVSLPTAIAQGVLLERFEGLERNAAGYAKKSNLAPHAKRARSLGHEYDTNALDLVDIFSTHRTPRQIRRALAGSVE